MSNIFVNGLNTNRMQSLSAIINNMIYNKSGINLNSNSAAQSSALATLQAAANNNKIDTSYSSYINDLQTNIDSLSKQSNNVASKISEMSSLKNSYSKTATTLDSFINSIKDSTATSIYDYANTNTDAVDVDLLTSNITSQRIEYNVLQVATATIATSNDLRGVGVDLDTKIVDLFAGSYDGTRLTSTRTDITGSTTMAQLGVTTGSFEIGGHLISVDSSDTVDSVIEKFNAAGYQAGFAPVGDGNFKFYIESDTESLAIRNQNTNFGEIMGLTVSKGTFSINGYELNITDNTTLQNIISKINSDSKYGVGASLDGNKIQLVANKTGDVYIEIAKGSSNFTNAIGFTAGGVMRTDNLVVGNEGKAQSLKGTQTVSEDMTFSAGNFSITSTGNGSVNRVEINVEEGDTLADVIRKINESGLNITASIEDDKLKLEQNQCGSAYNMTVEAGSSDFTQQVGLTDGTSSIGVLSPGLDADYFTHLDGTQTIANADDMTVISAGSFKINNKTIQLAAGSVNSAIEQINLYSEETGVIAELKDNKVVLRNRYTGTDTLFVEGGTSNFGAVTGLTSSSTSAATSTIGSKGSASTITGSETLSLSTMISASAIKINGTVVNISEGNILNAIRDINAATSYTHVKATTVGNKLVLSETRNGDLPITVEDMSGNFGAVTGIIGYTVVAGREEQYGGTRTTVVASKQVSNSMQIMPSSLTINGTTINVSGTIRDALETINANSVTTGVEAYINTDNRFVFRATSYGDQDVNVEINLSDLARVIGMGTYATEDGTDSHVERIFASVTGSVSGLDEYSQILNGSTLVLLTKDFDTGVVTSHPEIDISGATTIGELISRINAQTGTTKVAARLNEHGEFQLVATDETVRSIGVEIGGVGDLGRVTGLGNYTITGTVSTGEVTGRSCSSITGAQNVSSDMQISDTTFVLHYANDVGVNVTRTYSFINGTDDDEDTITNTLDEDGNIVQTVATKAGIFTLQDVIDVINTGKFSGASVTTYDSEGNVVGGGGGPARARARGAAAPPATDEYGNVLGNDWYVRAYIDENGNFVFRSRTEGDFSLGVEMVNNADGTQGDFGHVVGVSTSYTMSFDPSQNRKDVAYILGGTTGLSLDDEIIGENTITIWMTRENENTGVDTQTGTGELASVSRTINIGRVDDGGGASHNMTIGELIDAINSTTDDTKVKAVLDANGQFRLVQIDDLNAEDAALYNTVGGANTAEEGDTIHYTITGTGDLGRVTGLSSYTVAGSSDEGVMSGQRYTTLNGTTSVDGSETLAEGAIRVIGMDADNNNTSMIIQIGAGETLESVLNRITNDYDLGITAEVVGRKVKLTSNYYTELAIDAIGDADFLRVAGIGQFTIGSCTSVASQGAESVNGTHSHAVSKSYVKIDGRVMNGSLTIDGVTIDASGLTVAEIVQNINNAVNTATGEYVARAELVTAATVDYDNDGIITSKDSRIARENHNEQVASYIDKLVAGTLDNDDDGLLIIQVNKEGSTAADITASGDAARVLGLGECTISVVDVTSGQGVDGPGATYHTHGVTESYVRLVGTAANGTVIIDGVTIDATRKTAEQLVSEINNAKNSNGEYVARAQLITAATADLDGDGVLTAADAAAARANDNEKVASFIEGVIDGTLRSDKDGLLIIQLNREGASASEIQTTGDAGRILGLGNYIVEAADMDGGQGTDCGTHTHGVVVSNVKLDGEAANGSVSINGLEIDATGKTAEQIVDEINNLKNANGEYVALAQLVTAFTADMDDDGELTADDAALARTNDNERLAQYIEDMIAGNLDADRDGLLIIQFNDESTSASTVTAEGDAARMLGLDTYNTTTGQAQSAHGTNVTSHTHGVVTSYVKLDGESANGLLMIGDDVAIEAAGKTAQQIANEINDAYDSDGLYVARAELVTAETADLDGDGVLTSADADAARANGSERVAGFIEDIIAGNLDADRDGLLIIQLNAENSSAADVQAEGDVARVLGLAAHSTAVSSSQSAMGTDNLSHTHAVTKSTVVADGRALNGTLTLSGVVIDCTGKTAAEIVDEINNKKDSSGNYVARAELNTSTNELIIQLNAENTTSDDIVVQGDASRILGLAEYEVAEATSVSGTAGDNGVHYHAVSKSQVQLGRTAADGTIVLGGTTIDCTGKTVEEIVDTINNVKDSEGAYVARAELNEETGLLTIQMNRNYNTAPNVSTIIKATGDAGRVLGMTAYTIAAATRTSASGTNGGEHSHAVTQSTAIVDETAADGTITIDGVTIDATGKTAAELVVAINQAVDSSGRHVARAELVLGVDLDFNDDGIITMIDATIANDTMSTEAAANVIAKVVTNPSHSDKYGLLTIQLTKEGGDAATDITVEGAVSRILGLGDYSGYSCDRINTTNTDWEGIEKGIAKLTGSEAVFTNELDGLEAGSFNVKVGNTVVGTVSYTADDTIDDIVAKIEDLQYTYNTGKYVSTPFMTDIAKMDDYDFATSPLEGVHEITSKEEAIAQGYTIIRTAEQLHSYRSHNGTTAKVILMNDIDMSSCPNFSSDTSVPPFWGEFNGNGYTIYGLQGSSSLFDSLQHATIKNLNLVGDTTGSALLARSASMSVNVTNVKVYGSVTSSAGYVGGLIAEISDDVTISNCFAHVKVNATSSSAIACGGLVGYASGTSVIEDSHVIGSVYSNDKHAGGLVGKMRNTSELQYSTFEGTVESRVSYSPRNGGEYFVGAFVGDFLSSNKVTNCRAILNEDVAMFGVAARISVGDSASTQNCNIYRVNSGVGIYGRGGAAGVDDDGGEIVYVAQVRANHHTLSGKLEIFADVYNSSSTQITIENISGNFDLLMGLRSTSTSVDSTLTTEINTDSNGITKGVASLTGSVAVNINDLGLTGDNSFDVKIGDTVIGTINYSEGDTVDDILARIEALEYTYETGQYVSTPFTNGMAADDDYEFYTGMLEGVHQITTEAEAIAQGYTVIHDVDELRNISSGGKYILMNNIKMTGSGSIANTFSGEFNGNGYEISNVNGRSLFGTVTGEVKNLNVQCGIGSGAGILAKKITGADAKITNVHVVGSINSSASNIGGIAGELSDGAQLTDCTAQVYIATQGGSESYNVGGLVGSVSGSSTVFINHCYASGGVYSDGSLGDEVGGLVGSAVTVNISNSAFEGSVYSKYNNAKVGCLIGSVCSNIGAVSNCNGVVECVVAPSLIGSTAGAPYLSVRNCNVYTEPNDAVDAADYGVTYHYDDGASFGQSSYVDDDGQIVYVGQVQATRNATTGQIIITADVYDGTQAITIANDTGDFSLITGLIDDSYTFDSTRTDETNEDWNGITKGIATLSSDYIVTNDLAGLESGSFNVKVGDLVLGTVTYTADDSIDDILAQIEGMQYIYTTSHKVDDSTPFTNGMAAYDDYSYNTGFLSGVHEYATDDEARAAGYTVIHNADELKSKISVNAGGKYILMGDIDMSDPSLNCRLTGSTFTGELHGNGHTIFGVHSNNLFNSIEDAVIKNLNIVGTTTQRGLLANYATNSEIDMVHVFGTVASSGLAAGGLIGSVGSETHITACTAQVNVSTSAASGPELVGGLVGVVLGNSWLVSCYVSGNIDGSGIVGCVDASTIFRVAFEGTAKYGAIANKVLSGSLLDRCNAVIEGDHSQDIAIVNNASTITDCNVYTEPNDDVDAADYGFYSPFDLSYLDDPASVRQSSYINPQGYVCYVGEVHVNKNSYNGKITIAADVYDCSTERSITIENISGNFDTLVGFNSGSWTSDTRQDDSNTDYGGINKGVASLTGSVEVYTNDLAGLEGGSFDVKVGDVVVGTVNYDADDTLDDIIAQIEAMQYTYATGQYVTTPFTNGMAADDDNSFNTGLLEGTHTYATDAAAEAAGYTVIHNATELKSLIAADSNGKYVLMCDIDMSDPSLDCRLADNFSGELNGNGYTISGVHGNNLFGTISSGIVRDLNIVGSTTQQGLLANSYTAAAFVLRGLYNVHVIGTVTTSAENAGGLLGSSEILSLSNCSAQVNVTGALYVGGLIGNVKSTTINNCYASGNIVGTYGDSYAGGLVGNADIRLERPGGTLPTVGGGLGGGLCGGLGSSGINTTISNSAFEGSVGGNAVGAMTGKITDTDVVSIFTNCKAVIEGEPTCSADGSGGSDLGCQIYTEPNDDVDASDYGVRQSSYVDGDGQVVYVAQLQARHDVDTCKVVITADVFNNSAQSISIVNHSGNFDTLVGLNSDTWTATDTRTNTENSDYQGIQKGIATTTGTVSVDLDATFEEGSFDVKLGDTLIGTITYSSTDTLDDIIAKIEELQYEYDTGHIVTSPFPNKMTYADDYSFEVGITEAEHIYATEAEAIADGYTVIHNVTELKNMTENGKYILMSNIDLSSESNSQILYDFSGELNGNGYVISGVNNSLFRYLNGGTVTHLGVQGHVVSNKQHAGMLADVAIAARVSNVYLLGSVEDTFNAGFNAVGGMFGVVSDGTLIMDSFANVDVTSHTSFNDNSCGGLVGQATDNNNDCGNAIENCIVSGTVNGTHHVGGIVGSASNANLTISNSAFQGQISHGEYSNGSIVGYVMANTTTINRCNGDITNPDELDMVGQVSAVNPATVNIIGDGLHKAIFDSSGFGTSSALGSNDNVVYTGQFQAMRDNDTGFVTVKADVFSADEQIITFVNDTGNFLYSAGLQVEDEEYVCDRTVIDSENIDWNGIQKGSTKLTGSVNIDDGAHDISGLQGGTLTIYVAANTTYIDPSTNEVTYATPVDNGYILTVDYDADDTIDDVLARIGNLEYDIKTDKKVSTPFTNGMAADDDNSFNTGLLEGVHTYATDAEAEADGYTVIHNVTELKSLIAADSAGKFVLMGNIDMSDPSLDCRLIEGNFIGELNGNGYTISGVHGRNLFGAINGKIKNLNVVGSTTNCGLIATVLSGSNAEISNVNVVGSVNTSMIYAGGLVGSVTSLAKIVDSSAQVDVTSTYAGSNGYVGGIAGYVNNAGAVSSKYTAIEGCYASGTISSASSSTKVGGLVGDLNGFVGIENSSFEGSVSAVGTGGAIAGSMVITRSFVKNSNAVIEGDTSLNLIGSGSNATNTENCNLYSEPNDSVDAADYGVRQSSYVDSDGYIHYVGQYQASVLDGHVVINADVFDTSDSRIVIEDTGNFTLLTGLKDVEVTLDDYDRTDTVNVDWEGITRGQATLTGSVTGLTLDSSRTFQSSTTGKTVSAGEKTFDVYVGDTLAGTVRYTEDTSVDAILQQIESFQYVVHTGHYVNQETAGNTTATPFTNGMAADDDNSFNTGVLEGTHIYANDTEAEAAGYTVIHDAAELKSLIAANSAGKFVLMGNIDMSDPSLDCRLADNFSGELNGNGYTISGVHGNNLFNVISGKIKNLNVVGSTTCGGLIANSLSGSGAEISNVHAVGSVNSTISAGGLVGSVLNLAKITNSSAQVDVTSTSTYVGGIAGFVRNVGPVSSEYTAIDGCYASGTISSTHASAHVGGLVGTLSGYIGVENSAFEGSVRATGSVGALTGSLGNWSYIKDSNAVIEGDTSLNLIGSSASGSNIENCNLYSEPNDAVDASDYGVLQSSFVDGSGEVCYQAQLQAYLNADGAIVITSDVYALTDTEITLQNDTGSFVKLTGLGDGFVFTPTYAMGGRGTPSPTAGCVRGDEGLYTLTGASVAGLTADTDFSLVGGTGQKFTVTIDDGSRTDTEHTVDLYENETGGKISYDIYVGENDTVQDILDEIVSEGKRLIASKYNAQVLNVIDKTDIDGISSSNYIPHTDDINFTAEVNDSGQVVIKIDGKYAEKITFSDDTSGVIALLGLGAGGVVDENYDVYDETSGYDRIIGSVDTILKDFEMSNLADESFTIYSDGVAQAEIHINSGMTIEEIIEQISIDSNGLYRAGIFNDEIFEQNHQKNRADSDSYEYYGEYNNATGLVSFFGNESIKGHFFIECTDQSFADTSVSSSDFTRRVGLVESSGSEGGTSVSGEHGLFEYDSDWIAGLRPNSIITGIQDGQMTFTLHNSPAASVMGSVQYRPTMEYTIDIAYNDTVSSVLNKMKQAVYKAEDEIYEHQDVTSTNRLVDDEVKFFVECDADMDAGRIVIQMNGDYAEAITFDSDTSGIVRALGLGGEDYTYDEDYTSTEISCGKSMLTGSVGGLSESRIFANMEGGSMTITAGDVTKTVDVGSMDRIKDVIDKINEGGIFDAGLDSTGHVYIKTKDQNENEIVITGAKEFAELTGLTDGNWSYVAETEQGHDNFTKITGSVYGLEAGQKFNNMTTGAFTISADGLETVTVNVTQGVTTVGDVIAQINASDDFSAELDEAGRLVVSTTKSVGSSIVINEGTTNYSIVVGLSSGVLGSSAVFEQGEADVFSELRGSTTGLDMTTKVSAGDFVVSVTQDGETTSQTFTLTGIESLSDVAAMISNSSLGISAIVNGDGSLSLKAKTSGDIQISLQDGTSNFAEMTGFTQNGAQANAAVLGSLSTLTSTNTVQSVLMLGFTSGTFEIELLNTDGTVSDKAVINIAKNDTVDSVISKINGCSLGLTAGVDASGKLVIQRDSCTTAGGLRVVKGSSDFTNKIGFTTGGQQISGVSASGEDATRTVLRSNDLSLPSASASLGVCGITDGTFLINGVTISVKSTDSVTTLISKINAAFASDDTAGVYAEYIGGRIVLTGNCRTGGGVINVESGTSNIAEVMGFTNVSSGVNSLQDLGLEAEYSINGVTHRSDSNVISLDDYGNFVDIDSTDEVIRITLKEIGSGVIDIGKKAVTDAANKLASFVNSFNAMTALSAASKLKSDAEFAALVNSLLPALTNKVGSYSQVGKELSAMGITIYSTRDTVGNEKISIAFNKDKFINAYLRDPQRVLDVLVGNDSRPIDTNKAGSFTRLADKLSKANTYFTTSISSLNTQAQNLALQIAQNTAELNNITATLALGGADSSFDDMSDYLAQLQVQYDSVNELIKKLKNNYNQSVIRLVLS